MGQDCRLPEQVETCFTTSSHDLITQTNFMRRIQVIDSHTAGEPTRTVISGGPDLGNGSLAERRLRLQNEHREFMAAVVNEPRGSDVLVGAMLVEPVDPECVAGAIYFNNVGVLKMCGHGTIGVVVTLAHLGRIQPGMHKLETPVGIVSFEYLADHRVTIENVPSYRYRKAVSVDVPGIGAVSGDVAWGGNWFFLIGEHGLTLSLDRIDQLTDFSWQVRQALEVNGITGEDGGEIDHIELFGPPQSPEANSRNFVLCPGKAYDRSPCGTGTSAKVACLFADGKLKEGANWRQESIVGTFFDATYRLEDGRCRPRITGTAYVNAESTLLLDPADPFAMGIPR